GRLPILVGGTGLYFKALTRGLAAVPPIPAQIRSAVRERLKREGIAALYAELSARDGVTARRVMPADRSRVTRALEVVLATGRSLTEWHTQGMTPAVAPQFAVRIFLDLDRAHLSARIARGSDKMWAAGPREEVRALPTRGRDSALPAMKAHGVPWLIRHLNGEIDLAAAVDEAKRDTRRYSKRQGTWFRHQLPDWTWATPDTALGDIRRGLAR